MRNVIFLFTVFFLVVSCSNSKRRELVNSNALVLKGKISTLDKEVKTISLRYNIIKGKKEIVKVDTNGNFAFNVELPFPEYVSLRTGKSQMHVYAEPGNEISILVKKDSVSGEYAIDEVAGDNSEITNHLHAYFKWNNLPRFDADYVNITKDELYRKLENRIALEDSLQKVFNDSLQTSDKFRQWLSNRTRYAQAHWLLYYDYYKKKAGMQVESDLFQTDMFPTDNDEALTDIYYPIHLGWYVHNVYVLKDSTNQVKIHTGMAEEVFDSLFSEIMEKETAGISRDIMLFELLLGLDGKKDFESTKKWDEIAPYVESKMIAKIIEEYISSEKNTLKAEQVDKQLIDLGYPSSIFNQIREKHRGKIVYIDFWASWCGPCINEISHSHKLQERCKDKPISFVNICMASDSLKWLKAIEKHSVTGDNYYVSPDYTESFSAKLNIEGFPTYYILDKKGNLTKTIRPSSSGIDDILQFYLQ